MYTYTHVYIYIIISHFPPAYQVKSLVRPATSQSDHCRGKGSVAAGDSERFEFCTHALWHSIAGRVFVRCLATHRTNSKWILIHRTRIMTTCRVLYLSDSSPGRTQICLISSHLFPAYQVQSLVRLATNQSDQVPL